MKSFIFLLFISFTHQLFAAEYIWSPNFSVEQRAIFDEVQKPWPANDTLSAQEAFEPVRKLMQSDADSLKVLEEATRILQSHGIRDVSEIIKYCEGGNSSADGFFNQSAQSLNARTFMPGMDPTPWEQKDLEKIKKAYSSKVIRLPFMELIAITTSPEVCARKGDTLRSTYETLVHELTHFIKRDIFFDVESLYLDRNFDNYNEDEITRAGGELDAFKAGVPAGIKLLKRIGVANPNLRFPMFDNEGVLQDPDALKTMIVNTYAPFYKEEKALDSALKNYISSQSWMLDTYKNHVRPQVTKMKNAELLNQIDSQITIVESRIKNIKIKYPVETK